MGNGWLCRARLSAFIRKTPAKRACGRICSTFVQKGLGEDELAVVDAGVKIKALQAAHINRYVVRLAVTFTARRNALPEHSRGRKPTYGRLVRPLPRQRKGKTLAATRLMSAMAGPNRGASFAWRFGG